MNTAVLVLLGLTAVLGLLLTAQGERVRPPWGALFLAVLLALAGALAWAGGDAPAGTVEAAARARRARRRGGRRAGRHRRPARRRPRRRGGDAAVRRTPRSCAAAPGSGSSSAPRSPPRCWSGSGEGLVVVLAVKGLGRYAELRAPAAAERFILGTLASALWAAACVGVAILLRST